MRLLLTDIELLSESCGIGHKDAVPRCPIRYRRLKQLEWGAPGIWHFALDARARCGQSPPSGIEIYYRDYARQLAPVTPDGKPIARSMPNNFRASGGV